MSKIDGRTALLRERADESSPELSRSDNQLPRWESWMTTSAVACAIMLAAAWMPREVARIVVGVGLVIALGAGVQFVLALRGT